jgi:MFS family permease
MDAASFLVSAGTLAFVRPLPGLASRDTHPLHDVAEGLRFVAADPMLRLLVGVIALANLCVTGPMLVGVPVLAATRFTQGAAAFGVIVSGYGAGNLGGMLAAGGLPRVSDRLFGYVASGLFVAFAVIFASLGFVASMWVAAALMVIAGLGNGYVAILVMTGLQRVTPEQLMGRVMSLVVLAMVGLGPVSQALAGLLVKISAPALFGTAGAGMLAIGVLVFARRTMWVFPETAIVFTEA